MYIAVPVGGQFQSAGKSLYSTVENTSFSQQASDIAGWSVPERVNLVQKAFLRSFELLDLLEVSKTRMYTVHLTYEYLWYLSLLITYPRNTTYILGIWPPGSLDDVWVLPAFWSWLFHFCWGREKTCRTQWDCQGPGDVLILGHVKPGEIL